LVALRAIDPKYQQQIIDTSELTVLNVDQFYGIEIEEFPARIAEVAMYLMDHLENERLGLEFGDTISRFPITSSATIVVGNACLADWNEVLPAKDCTHVLGNPPFVGMSMLDKEQQSENRLVFEELAETTGIDLKGRRTGRLDYVACWYAKAFAYMIGTQIRGAFVSTNSITQGDQARTMGPLIADTGFDITFAWPTFSWTSEARGKAAVHVVIIGFADSGKKIARMILSLGSDGKPAVENAKNINIYLTDSSVQAIGKHRKPLREVPTLTEGNRPQDGGGLIVEGGQRAAIESDDPIASKYLRRLIGAQGMLHDEPRWCLWLVDAPSKELKESPELVARMKQVAEARLASRTPSAREKALIPSLFLAIRQPTRRWLCVPRHSSENRAIIPMAFFEPDDIAHDSVLALDAAGDYLFGILQSKMFTVWAKAVSGRLESRIRMSPDLSYNSFPFPDEGANQAAVEAAARAVLEVRTTHPDESLHELYGTVPPYMPADLVQAHKTLDKAVDKAMRPKAFSNDSERLAFLLKRYEEITAQ
jgi:hypothetical protein